MNNMKVQNEKILWDFFREQPHYGKYQNVCHMCGSIYDISDKMIFDGNPGDAWEGVRFEFPICTDCLFQQIGESMSQMNGVMLRREIEKEIMLEKIYSFVQESDDENMAIE